ncbi:MAG: PKD domain-containing protein [Solirubrobacteraceae bacterium]
MRLRLALLTVLVPLALPASAGAAAGTFFPGDPVDGPSADVQSLGDVAVARDGTGAVAWVRKDGGVDHVFVARLVDGAFQPAERVDGGLDGPGSQPVVAASDGGRLAIAYVSGGTLYAVTRAGAASGYTAPQIIASGGSNPSVALSINGTAYLAYAQGGDVHAARLDRKSTSYTGVDGVLDIDPARDAGSATGRPKVAVAADGVATVVWGEGGSTYARRIFETRLSTAPQLVSDASDLPDIDSEDDSSYAWVTVRATIAGQPRALARRLVGSTFDPPVVIDGGEPASEPRIDMSGRGIGYAAMGSTASAGAFGAVLKDDKFNTATLLGGAGGPSFPVPATADNGDGLVAFQQTDAGGPAIHARPYDYVATSRAVTQPGPDATLSRADLGPTDASRGLLAAADRAGDVVVAYVQGGAGSSSIAVATFDRAPGTFLGYTSSRKFLRSARPSLKWGPSFELWGAVNYTVLIDGQPDGTTQSTGMQVPNPVPDGVYSWRVVATDRRGQTTATPLRYLRIDATPPKVSFRISGARRRGGLVKVTVRATDASGTKARASGLKLVRVSFGDRTRSVVTRHVATHRYARGGKVTVRVSATDKAGNVAVVKRRITIKG